MFSTKRLQYVKVKTLIGALLFLSCICFGQNTFNRTYEFGFHTAFVNVWEWNSNFYTCGLVQDSTGNQFSLNISRFDETGDELFQKYYYSQDTTWWTNDDCNISKDSIFIIAVHRYTINQEHTTLIWINSEGDSLMTRSFASPHFDPDIPDNNFISVRSIDKNEQGDIYVTSQLFQDEATGNDFVIMKLNAQGDSLWSYIVADSFGQYCYDIQAVDDGVIVATNSMTGPGTQKFFKLDSNGNYLSEWDFTCDETNESSGIPNEFILEEDGIVFATEYSDYPQNWHLPYFIKTDYSGNIMWEIALDGNHEYQQWNYHLVKAQDGGYVGAAWHNQLFPENVELNGIYNWSAWLIKISEQGALEWERFYHFIESPFDKHRVADLKATSDGGYIFCGDAIDNDIETNGQVIQKGWLVKVDGCGCLVPGCDEDCVVGIEETGVERSRYFRVGPNPASQFLNIYLSQYAIPTAQCLFQLRDMKGKLIKQFEARTFNTTYMLDVEKYENGTYILSLEIDGKTMQSEIIIKQ